MKPGKLILVLVILFLGTVIYFNKCSRKKNQPQPLSGAGKQGAPLLVSGIVLKNHILKDHIYTTGSILANEEVEIRNETAGRLVKINFIEGTAVKKGELLIKLFNEDLRAELQKLLLDKELAEKTESRQKDLLSVNGISQQDYEISLNNLNKTLAEIDQVKAEISKTEIYSPMSGIIGLRSVSEGAYLAANTKIATIQEVDPVKLEFSIPERYKDRIKDRVEVNFTIESSPDTFSGKVYAIEPKIDRQTRSLTLRALCSNPGHQLLPGSFARIEIAMRQVNNALMVPSQAVIPELKGQKVLICRGGKAAFVRVNTGLRNDSSVQIISGLQEGDTVLTTGIMQLRPDMPVKVQIVH